MLLMLRLESLYTDFILHKLIVNQNHSDRSMLIECSHTILSLVLSALTQRIILSRHRIDLEWSVRIRFCRIDNSQSIIPADIKVQLVYYAMPCASILILELLRQIEQPQQHFAIKRSTVIQDLSVLISCCDWLTEPNQQNYSLCKRAQSIFSRSLDRILNVPAQHPIFQPASELQSEQDNDAVVPMDAAQEYQQTLIEEQEWMAWLETCNLQADPWLDVFTTSTQAYPDGPQDNTQNGFGHI